MHIYVSFAQYVTYNGNAFIADFGGYLGLLLGQSIIAMYDMLVLYMDKATKYLQPQPTSTP